MPEKKRPIDKIRESAGSWKIEEPGDQTKITGFIKIGEKRLLIATERGLYEFKLADQIDPERTNISIPNVQQRVLHYGSQTRFVARTVQTASALFGKGHFSKINTDKVIELALAAAQELASMQDAADRLRAEQLTATVSGSVPVRNRMATLPVIANLDARVKNFVQSLDHAYKALFETTELFYGTGYRKRWFEAFVKLLSATLPPDDPYLAFAQATLPTLRQWRYLRDGIEHPNQTDYAAIKNYEIELLGNVRVPTIELVHHETPLPRTSLLDFMDKTIDEFSLIYENYLAYLADRYIEPFSKFPLGVIEFDPKEIGETFVRFSLAIDLGEGFRRFG